ncbi:MAG: KR domain-containing protein [Chloroflexi bacterium]|nr:KR domain-containing protein [Chloroflexota bacterium]
MNAEPLIHPDSVVLVTGGARGITAQCVIELAKFAHCKFILLGRSSIAEPEPAWASTCRDETEIKRHIMNDLTANGEKPTPMAVQKIYRRIQSTNEIKHTLEAVQAAGGQAQYLSADVSDLDGLQQLAPVVAKLGPITGIIHGAGSLADKLIEKKTGSDFDTVLSPKVDGLENLVTCVPPGQLDFLILFSSIVGFFGNVGQADYAIANEILNKSAYLLKKYHPACHVVSIDWGPWDGGMVTPELKKAFTERNIQVIPMEAGTRLLVNELTSGNNQSVQVVVGSQPVVMASELSGELKTFRIRRKLKLEDNPFLYDHVIGDHPVLPATCAALWIVNSCEQMYPGYTFLSLENFKVLKGIVFEDNTSKDYVLDLKEVYKNGSVKFDAVIWSQNQKGRTFYHYSLQVTLVRKLPEIPHIEPLDVVYANPVKGAEEVDLYHNGTLFHGPSFQGVERVLSLDSNKLTMQCYLPQVEEHTQGQFPVQTANPYIYDTIVQCLLIWAQAYYQAPCLPSSLDKFEQFRPVPFNTRFYVSMEVVSQSETSVVGDILVQDEQGQLFVRITGLEGTISKQLKRFIGKS